MKRMNRITKTLGLGLLTSTMAFLFVGCKSTDQQSFLHPTAIKPYPLDTCLITGEDFDHGEPYEFVYKRQEIKLCCKVCLIDFEREPRKYLKKIAAARDQKGN